MKGKPYLVIRPYDFEFGVEESEPEPFSIIFDHGMTAITWSDGSVTRTHCQQGDTFDPLFGVMACTLRKLTNNRGHAIDECEDCLHEMASSISKPMDVDGLLDFTLLMSDVLSVLQDSEKLWLDQLGEPEQKAPAKPENSKEPTKEVKEKPSILFKEKADYEPNVSESYIKAQERVRQKIRELIDKGEL